MDRRTGRSSFVEIVPLPSLSNSSKASLNSIRWSSDTSISFILSLKSILFCSQFHLNNHFDVGESLLSFLCLRFIISHWQHRIRFFPPLRRTVFLHLPH